MEKREGLLNVEYSWVSFVRKQNIFFHTIQNIICSHFKLMVAKTKIAKYHKNVSMNFHRIYTKRAAVFRHSLGLVVFALFVNVRELENAPNTVKSLECNIKVE